MDSFGLGHRTWIRSWTYRLAIILLSIASSANSQVTESIVDNTDPTVVVTGKWRLSNNASGYWGSNFLQDGDTGKGSKSVRYPLTLPAAAEYELFSRWVARSNRASNVPIDIVHSSGTTTRLFDQRTQGGVWVSLGVYTLPASGGAIVIRNTGTNGVVVADAIRVLRKSGAGGGSQPYAGAPLCASHDDRQAHGLWDAMRGCHYDHTHNGNPDEPRAAAIFGPASSYLGGKTISYPWQTHNHVGVEENVAKHNGYKWLVDIDLPPLYIQLNWAGKTANAVKAVRTQYHFLSTNADARVRLHSFWAEMQVCPTNAMNDCGIVRGGGLWDTGILHVPYKQQWVPVPGQDPVNLEGTIFRPGVDDPTVPWPTIDPYRGHSDTCQGLSVYTNQVSQTIDHSVLWTSAPGIFGYNNHMGLFVKVLDAAECIDPTDISKDVRLCPTGRCRFNGSEHVPLTYWAWVDPLLDGSALDSDRTKNGRVNFRGYTNEKGTIDLNCTATTEHCVPYSLENAPVGWAAWETPSNSGYWPERYKDHDISPPGEWWIKLPN